MASGPDFYESEEKKSYSTVFLVAVALLLACTVWAIWQDSFSRHLWKKWKGDFYRVAIGRYEEQLAQDHERLAQIPEYVALTNELDEVQSALTGAGDAGKQLEQLREELAEAEIRVMERDLDLRLVKSEIEEAWYLLEKAQHEGGSGDAEHAALAQLEAEKERLEKPYEDAMSERDRIQAQIGELRARESAILDEIREYQKEREIVELKLESVAYDIFGRHVPKVPTVEQVVLPSFERNNFEQWVDRVDRCMNCHVAIDRAGFEDLPNPMKTHPNRSYYLGNHEVRKFGCTPCHGGQGPSINSVEQAHGFVTFWEDPLLSTADMVQAKCLQCHQSVNNFQGEGAEIAGRGEQLFREMGCHGCHLVQGMAELEKAGPSLYRIAAKVSPEWLVEWIENPKDFRPRTRMPHFFLSRAESTAIAGYLLSSSIDDSRTWLDSHQSPTGVEPGSADLVAKGKKLTESLGCLACHGFEPDQYASQVAITMDVAPNLARMAEKTDPRWMYHWIRNPRGYSDTSRMPRLRLDHEEARAITSYLATLREQDNLPVDTALRVELADPGTADEGARLIRKYGCYGCHNIHGMEGESRVSVELSSFGAKHLEELFFGDRLDIEPTWEAWTVTKILSPRTYETERIEQNMPQFGFDEADARAITTYLKSRTDKKLNPNYLPDREGRAAKLGHGRELVSYYNCYGCHSFDGREGAVRRYYEDDIDNAPPILVGEGKKVQPEWFFDFLKKPMRLRPWLDIRMPTFGLSDDETSAIVDYFAALDGYELGPVVLEAREEAHAPLLAHSDRPEEYFDCYSCHPQGPGRPADDHYLVSRTPLTAAEINAWMSENLGVETASGSAEDGRRTDELREYLGAGGN